MSVAKKITRAEFEELIEGEDFESYKEKTAALTPFSPGDRVRVIKPEGIEYFDPDGFNKYVDSAGHINDWVPEMDNLVGMEFTLHSNGHDPSGWIFVPDDSEVTQLLDQGLPLEIVNMFEFTPTLLDDWLEPVESH